jgi:small subunit ribosomal protein S1
MSRPSAPDESVEEFARRWEIFLWGEGAGQGRIVEARVLSANGEVAEVSVREGMNYILPAVEVRNDAECANLKKGDIIDVLVTDGSQAGGKPVISFVAARAEKQWRELESSFFVGRPVKGLVAEKIKGGLKLRLGDWDAFMPAKEAGGKAIRDLGVLLGRLLEIRVLSIDRARRNIIVSRRAIMAEDLARRRSAIVASLAVGQDMEGRVKNITDYGAFIDLGGVDALLHVTDMAWRRVSHPSEILKIGDVVRVRIIRLDAETQRINLSIKHLQPDPWELIKSKYPAGTRVKGTVTNIADYGAFIELEPGVEGLLRVSEMGWSQKPIHPAKLLRTGQTVEVIVLETSIETRRIGLGMKQAQTES